MNKGRKVALEYWKNDLNPVPLDKNKVAVRSAWGESIPEDEIDNYDFTNIGICTGIVSGGLEAIDFDLKYAPRGNTIMKDFQDRVGGDLISKLPIQKTKNGGYHLLYRCSEIEGNRVLARNEEGEVLIETRGEGGYIQCYPSEGYEMVRGDFKKIPIISPLERNRLLAAAFMLDKEAHVKSKRLRKADKSKFPKYDADPEIGLELLKKHGWVEVERGKEYVELRRPNKDVGMSGGYNLDGNFLYLFTTSTGFKERTPYNNVGIFAELECDGDYRVAYARLGELGYGTKSKKEDDDYDFELSLESLSFISTREDEREYLDQVAKDLIPQGLSTGWPDLDEYFRLKSNSFNVGLGLDGVGKSVFMSSLAVASNILHGWKWAMVCPENKTAMNRRRIIEAASGQPLRRLAQHPRTLERFTKQSYDYFHIVANKKHWTIVEVIEMGKRLHEYYGINALLIDPYNFFKVDSANGYSWNNEILSQLRVFAEDYCSVYLMAHPQSETPRKLKDADGYLKAPSSYDIQGGADFPYRVDDFFVLHRIKNHPDKEVQSAMQFIVHKIKETETGGKVHPMGEYTSLSWDYIDNFMGYFDSKGNNPMLQHKKGLFTTPEIVQTTNGQLFPDVL